MIDLHCHILPNVDDGSHSMEETIALLKSAEKAGFETICFTPHYAEPQYINSKEQNQQILKQVENIARKNNISMKFLLGNEIFIQDRILELLESKQISSLADTKYVLIELPMYQELPQEVVQKLVNPLLEKDIKVIMAHPERYTYIQKNPQKVREYFGEDIILQGNYASIIGAYGREAQKTIKKLLKNKAISYLSADVHHINRCFYEEMDAIKKKLLKVVDERYFEILTERNPKLILENKDIIFE